MLCSVNSAPLKKSTFFPNWVPAYFTRRLSQSCVPELLAWEMKSLRVKAPPAWEPITSGRGLRCFLTHPELTVPMLLTFVHGAQAHPQDFTGVEHMQWKVACDPPRPLVWPTKAPPSFTYTFLPLPGVSERMHAQKHIYTSGLNSTSVVFTLGLSQT